MTAGISLIPEKPALVERRYSWIRPPFERKPGMDIGVLCKKRLYGSKKLLPFQNNAVK